MYGILECEVKMVERERIAAYLFSLEKDMPVFLSEMERRALEKGVPIIRESTRQLLRFFMALAQPQTILEVGTATGFSGIYMMTYLRKYREDAELTTIEKVQYRIEDARENFCAADLSDKVTQLCGNAQDILQELAEQKKEFEFIFMDAAKGQYLSFYPFVKKLLKTGGMLVSDNVLQEGTLTESRYSITRRDRTIHTRMREYLYILTHDEDFETVILPMGDGVAVSYNKQGD